VRDAHADDFGVAEQSSRRSGQPAAELTGGSGDDDHGVVSFERWRPSPLPAYWLVVAAEPESESKPDALAAAPTEMLHERA
jgi:hypothetical protein